MQSVSAAGSRQRPIDNRTSKKICSCLLAIAGCVSFAFLPFALAQTKPSASEPWGKALAAAKNEGQVNVYIGGWGAVLDEGVFQKRFPEIKLVGVALRGRGDIAKRNLAETRA